MAVKLHILKESGTLQKFEPQITTAFEAGLKSIEDKLSLPPVDVVVDDDANSAIPETGVGGFAPSANLLYIHINPNFPSIAQKLDLEFRSTLAHELHHCVRWAARGYGKNLLEALISEGLADHFDIEVNGGQPKPWSIAITGEELQKLKQRAKTEFSNEHYNHSAWFFGSDVAGLPRWGAYSLGFSMANDYIKKTGRKASELVAEDARSFLDA